MKKLLAVFMLTSILLSAGCAPVSPPDNPPSPTPSASAPATPSATQSPSAPPTASPPASPEAPTVAEYFPFTPDVHMTYLGIGNEYAGFESWVDYIDNGALQLRTNNGGTELAAVYTVEDGALKRVFSREETYFRIDYTAERTKDEILLMEPLAVGTAWTLEDGDRRSITATDASVTVPYGTFSALEVTTEHDDSISKDYYVRDLGLVKREFIVREDPANPITSALMSVTTEPFTQTVRFYYSDEKNDVIVYDDKEIQFNTNETAASVFQEEFKAAPPGSGLTRIIRSNAVLNGIAFSSADGVVTADFSKTFVTEMNPRLTV